jgi:hypothetical protein
MAAAAMLGLCLALCLQVLRLDPLSPAMVYLYIFGLFHLGLIVPWALDIHSGAVPWWLRSYRLTPALSLLILALLAFQLGATLAVSRWGSARVSTEETRCYYNAILFQGGLVIVALGLLSFGWGIRSIGFSRFLQANYIETFRLVRLYDPRLFTTSLTLVPVGLYLLAASAPQRLRGLVLVPTLLWTALIFFLGFRGFALIPLITTLAVLRKRGFRMPVAAYGVGLAVLLVAIPMARSMRNSRLQQRSVSQAATEVRPLAAIEEMGGSLQPLVHTVRLMENEKLRWGSTYWQALKRVLPNLSLAWQGQTYVPLEDLPPTHWVTRLAAPWKYRHFGGIGFSGVAEPYMNFGSAGVGLYFFFLAVVLVWADRFDAGRPTRLALWAVMLGPLLMTTRGAFDSFFRPAIWGVAIVIVMRVVSDSLHLMQRPSPSGAPRVSGLRPPRGRRALEPSPPGGAGA